MTASIRWMERSFSLSPKVGRYRIEAGNRITVESEPGVPERNVRLFLLGSAFGVLLHQRGLLPVARQCHRNRRAGSRFHGPIGGRQVDARRLVP